MLIIFTLIFLIIDIFSKILVSNILPLEDSIHVVPGFFDLTYVRNTGVAWSLYDNNKYFVIILSGIIILAICFYVIKEKPSRLSLKLAYSLILGGAIGNFISRIFYGYVIDFIDIKIFGYNYPIFNLADIFIVLGGILLVYATWRDKNGDKSSR